MSPVLPHNAEEAHEGLLRWAALRGEAALQLAMRAAVPQHFRPDLLHLLRLNFVSAVLATAAEPDVLFATFCTASGDLYSFESETRWLLLQYLEEGSKPGYSRVCETAEFLLAYLDQESHGISGGHDLAMEDYIETERWSALAFAHPSEAASQLARALSSATLTSRPAARLRFGTLVPALLQPLATYPELLVYAKGMDALMCGRPDEASQIFGRFSGESVEVAGVRLEIPVPTSQERFGDTLSKYEQVHPTRLQTGEEREVVEGTVVAINAESVFLDIGYKTEGVLSLSECKAVGERVKISDKIFVSVVGEDRDGYYRLRRVRTDRPTDWSALEKVFADKSAIAGVVSAVVKGGLTVDVGVRAFMPASRSGARDAAEIEKLVGQEIRCRIIKLDVADEDVVVDRRAVLEEDERANKDKRYTEVKEGETVHGTVRSLTDYGAFVDIGGVDALLHVADISWGRVKKPSDVLRVGEMVEARILKVDPAKKRISLGLKQLQPHPWELVAEKYKVGDRIQGMVTRVTDFGAFVELEKGIEGLVHLSEMSWSKRLRKPADVVSPGDGVEVVVLGINAPDRRISLGLKQALGDPWADATQKYPVGSVVEGPVISIQKFGAFVQVAEGVEGMVHVSDVSARKRINHPQDVLHMGQLVKAQVLELDIEKRRLRLGMRQLIPTSLDEYIAEHQKGDVVTGRVTAVSGSRATVELAEGVHASCRLSDDQAKSAEGQNDAKTDLRLLTAMLQARWKGGAGDVGKEVVRIGEIRNFRITLNDKAQRKIELEVT
jgi:small subunit ribosomal protein S1